MDLGTEPAEGGRGAGARPQGELMNTVAIHARENRHGG